MTTSIIKTDRGYKVTVKFPNRTYTGMFPRRIDARQWARDLVKQRAEGLA